MCMLRISQWSTWHEYAWVSIGTRHIVEAGWWCVCCSNQDWSLHSRQEGQRHHWSEAAASSETAEDIVQLQRRLPRWQAQWLVTEYFVHCHRVVCWNSSEWRHEYWWLWAGKVNEYSWAWPDEYWCAYCGHAGADNRTHYKCSLDADSIDSWLHLRSASAWETLSCECLTLSPLNYWSN